MRIAFRTDASIQIGTGHVMRCLTLADLLRMHGATCYFICRSHNGHLADFIRQRGHEVILLPLLDTNFQAPPDPMHAAWLGTDWSTDADQTRSALMDLSVDRLVVDHYALDSRWEQALRPISQFMMVIDDLADRPHDCDLLLDQNLGRTKQDYLRLLKADTHILVGPHYALLRPEFAQLRPYSLHRRMHPQFKHLLITMGGVDKDNVTGQILHALNNCPLPAYLRITVVMGQHAPWLAQVKSQAAQMPAQTDVLVGANNMGQLMSDSDLAIGAAGSTSWERCCLGLPTILVVMAANQKEIAAALEQNKAAVVAETRNLLELLPLLLEQTSNASAMKAMTTCATNITDGNGATRVARFLLEGINENYADLQ